MRASGWGLAIGVVMVTGGVLLHLPDLAMMYGGHHAGMAGMSMWTPTMTGGMLLLVIGLAVATFSLFRWAPKARLGAGVTAEAIEHGRLRTVYWLTFLALTVALVEDIMKPLTLGFVLPGMREEYGLSLAQVSTLPIVALTGTAVGSVVWGLIGDRYGRRTALLLATVLFVATSACGAMPSFGWNLGMCFAMGMSAGGLLPLAFTLIAELTPRRHRGWTAVLLGSVGGLGGYLAASTAAHYLEPTFSWRALWLIGLPTGLLLLAMTPFIPESPLHLLRSGEPARAAAVLARYGSHIRHTSPPSAAGTAEPHPRSSLRELLWRYPKLTVAVGVLGTVWGLVNFGFLVLLPTELGQAGMTSGAASGLLARSTLYSAPALALVVLLYTRWHGRRSLAVFTAAGALALTAIGGWSATELGNGLLLAAVGMLILAQSAINAMLLPYSAEIYPTALRATGTGLAAAATKLGGIAGPSTVLLMLQAGGGGIHVPALVLAVLAVAAAALILRFGPETRVGPAPAGADLEPDRASGPVRSEVTA